ncbi:hypothetical protein [Ornithinibacillus xuwenensis]|uniref:DUF4129 domain-containing protein n=1 Tax=Ornithinibacillus xuwenensis TaxID=3144668 RepID=A0ABU9XJD6_9BACI
MVPKNPYISYGYHFINEAIILFLLLIPVFHFYYNWVPYWSYLLLISMITIGFSVIAKKTTSYYPYFISSPFLVLLFLLCGYPFYVSILISIVLIWRYVRIRSELIMRQEIRNMVMTGLLTLIMTLLIREVEVIIYLFFQCMVIVIGSFVSHISVTSIRTQHRSNRMLSVTFAMFLCIGGMLSYYIAKQDMLTRLWDTISYAIFLVIGRIVNLFQFVEDIEFANWLQSRRMGSREESLENGTAFLDFLLPGYTLFMISGFVLSVIGLIYIIQIYSNDYSPLGESVSKRVANIITNNRKEKHRLLKKIIQNFSFKRANPVRQMVYKFERRATKYQKGREKSETVEDWLRRIGFQTNLEVYQRVRYGEKNVKEQEIFTLRKELQKIEEDFKS